jgi:hypothetical protein
MPNSAKPVSANKQAALDAAAKRKAAEQRERQGSTYRQYHYACNGAVPPGAYYDQSTETREEWMAKAETAAAALASLGLLS